MEYESYYRLKELHLFCGKVFYEVDKNLLKDRELILQDVKLMINTGEFTCNDYSGCFEFDDYIEVTKSIIQICGKEKTLYQELDVKSSTDFYIFSKENLVNTNTNSNSITYDATKLLTSNQFSVLDFKVEIFNNNQKINEVSDASGTIVDLSGYGECTFYITARISRDGSKIPYKYTYKEYFSF